MNEERKLRELVERIVAERERAVSVSPSWVATETMMHLDPERASEPCIYLAAHLQFRQVARQILGRKFERDDDAIEDQHPLFPSLQRRYPLPHKRGEEPQYKLLDYLSGAELAFNVSRLRKEAAGKLAHADALEAWGLEPNGRAA